MIVVVIIITTAFFTPCPIGINTGGNNKSNGVTGVSDPGMHRRGCRGALTPEQ